MLEFPQAAVGLKRFACNGFSRLGSSTLSSRGPPKVLARATAERLALRWSSPGSQRAFGALTRLLWTRETQPIFLGPQRAKFTRSSPEWFGRHMSGRVINDGRLGNTWASGGSRNRVACVLSFTTESWKPYYRTWPMMVVGWTMNLSLIAGDLDPSGGTLPSDTTRGQRRRGARGLSLGLDLGLWCSDSVGCVAS